MPVRNVYLSYTQLFFQPESGCNLLPQPLPLSFYLCAGEMVEDSSARSYLSQWSWQIAECVASLVKLEFHFDLWGYAFRHSSSSFLG